MNRLEEILKNPKRFNLSPLAVSKLRFLLEGFEKNPMFPMPKYEYAKKFLYPMYQSGQISGDLMESILEEF